MVLREGTPQPNRPLLHFDLRVDLDLWSMVIKYVLGHPRYEMHLSTKYEVNRSNGLGGVRRQTDTHTHRRLTSNNKANWNAKRSEDTPRCPCSQTNYI